MYAPSKHHKLQILNALLRMMSMGAKLLLMLYMGRFFDMADIGTYGLVFGAVTMLGVILGQDLIYIVSREIVGEDATVVVHKMRDQVIHYGLNYIFLTLVIATLILTGVTHISSLILIYILMLTVLESLGTVTYYNMNSLGQQIIANAIFFIRSGIWVFPVIILCVINPDLRNIHTVLIGWIIGAILSLAATFWCWRSYPWRQLVSQVINWLWIRESIKKGSPIWLGMMGLTAGTFIDRFVVEHFLSLDAVGLLTFYSSFTNAMLTLMQSGVIAFATPRMIKHHRDGNRDDFYQEARNTTRQIAVSAGIIAIAIGITVPLIGYFFSRPALLANIWTLWVLLLAVWIRAISEGFSNILFAQHQDRAVWLGNMLFLIPALAGNLVFVPFFGFKGVGFSAIAASALLFLWRWYHVRLRQPA